MSLIFDIYNTLKPQPTPPLAQLAYGLCALPMPGVRIEPVKKKKAADMYVIDEATQTFGFHQATATRQNEGSEAGLTGRDIQILKERGYYGKTRDVVVKNERCKAFWHEGKTDAEAGVLLGIGASWVEKRYGTFSTALLTETGQAP